MWSAKQRLKMDVLDGWIGANIILGYLGVVHIAKTGGRYLLTSRVVPRQTGHTNYSVRAKKSLDTS